MSDQRDIGIAIEQIRLLAAHIVMSNPVGKSEYNLRLIGLGRFEYKDGKTLDLTAAFDMMHGIEKPLFKFTCEFIAHYTRRDESSMAWKDFSSAVALAHIIPYLREFVNNITNRLPAPVLILDPINTYAMIADYEERKRKAEEAKAAAQTIIKST